MGSEGLEDFLLCVLDRHGGGGVGRGEEDIRTRMVKCGGWHSSILEAQWGLKRPCGLQTQPDKSHNFWGTLCL